MEWNFWSLILWNYKLLKKKLLHLGFFKYLKKSIFHFMFGFGIFLKINWKLTSGDSPSNNLSGIFVNLKSKKYRFLKKSSEVNLIKIVPAERKYLVNFVVKRYFFMFFIKPIVYITHSDAKRIWWRGLTLISISIFTDYKKHHNGFR